MIFYLLLIYFAIGSQGKAVQYPEHTKELAHAVIKLMNMLAMGKLTDSSLDKTVLY